MRRLKRYMNEAAKREIRKVAAKYKYRPIRFSFGDPGVVKSLPKLHEERVNFLGVSHPWSPDELQGAFGRFNFHVLVQGCASEDGGPMWVRIDSLGIYARD